jgi:hypothetical protein
MHEVFGVIRALRTTEDCGAGMIIHRFRQRIAKAGTPDVERVAELRQSLTDTAG